MILVGCDLHTRKQQVAVLDTDTGALLEQELVHTGDAVEQFYAALPPPVTVGIESTGYSLWFHALLQRLGHTLFVGEAAKIRAMVVRKTKTDRRDARHLLDLLQHERFPIVWIPDPATRDLRALIKHLSFAKTPAGTEVVDPLRLIRPLFRLDDHSPTPLASALSLPRRRPSAARAREPGLASTARRLWIKLSRRPTGGRPQVHPEIKALIIRMATANRLWGAPRIHGELLKLGINVAERTVSRLMPKRRPRPSQTWRTFLVNHVRDLVSLDFFTVPTARLRVLFVLVVLVHHRRRVVHFNVTEHPTAHWTAQQIEEAFPDDCAPPYLLRDRDSVYGHVFQQRVKGMSICEVLTAPQSPWQNPFAERLIGSIRRECLNHVLVLSERHLRRILIRYFAYYHRARTHLALNKDAPHVRPVELHTAGRIVEIPEVGGLHHRYARLAA
jgi:putative transposase